MNALPANEKALYVVCLVALVVIWHAVFVWGVPT